MGTGLEAVISVAEHDRSVCSTPALYRRANQALSSYLLMIEVCSRMFRRERASYGTLEKEEKSVSSIARIDLFLLSSQQEA